MKDIHELINELGARLDEKQRYEAMMLLNQMFLDGYDDLFICIALIKVLARDDFDRNRYLFSYQPFLDEIAKLKIKYEKVDRLNKDFGICAVYESSGNVISDNDRALIDEYNELFNNSDDEESIQKYLDYLYMKYCFALEVVNNNIRNYKKIFRGTNDPGFCNFAVS